jgi:hypothetical protein
MFRDCEQRRIGALLRLTFYYPQSVEAPVLKQLNVASYNVFKADAFVRDTVYPEKSPEIRKEQFNRFVLANGPASSDGVLMQLFEDLDDQEADEQHRMSPPLTTKYDARAALIKLFGYKPNVKSGDKPYVKTWDSGEEARFVDALRHTKGQKVDAAVHAILAKTDDDYLAIACIHELAGKGDDQQLRDYCTKILEKHGDDENEYRKLLATLDDRRAKQPSTLPAK